MSCSLANMHGHVRYAHSFSMLDSYHFCRSILYFYHPPSSMYFNSGYSLLPSPPIGMRLLSPHHTHTHTHKTTHSVTYIVLTIPLPASHTQIIQQSYNSRKHNNWRPCSCVEGCLLYILEWTHPSWWTCKEGPCACVKVVYLLGNLSVLSCSQHLLL